MASHPSKSRKTRKQLASLAGISLFLLLIVASLMKPSLTIPPKKEAEKPDFLFEGVTISFYENETLTWKVQASSAAIYNSKDEVILTQAKGSFIQSETTEFYFQSPKGVLHFQSPIMQLYETQAGILSKEANLDITSAYLEWNRDTETLKGRGLTRVKKDNIVLEGEVFDVSLPIKKLTMTQNSRLFVEDTAL